MPFKRYVEIGRVCLINYGPEYGQLVVVSDVLDQSRVREGGEGGACRQICFFRPPPHTHARLPSRTLTHT